MFLDIRKNIEKKRNSKIITLTIIMIIYCVFIFDNIF